MKKIILFFLLSCCGSWVSAQSANALPQDPSACTNSFFQSLLEENGSSLSRLLTPDFGIVSFDGQVIDGYTLAEGVSGGYVIIDVASTSGIQTRTYGDAAVVTGLWKTKGKVQGNGFDTEVVFTSMCVKQGGAWKIASMQFTPIR